MSFIKQPLGDQDSQFKQITGEQEKRSWSNLSLLNITQDSKCIKVSNKYLAFSHESSQVGKLCILNLKERGPLLTDHPMINGHTDPIIDFEFLPFNENYIATCSSDATIKLWEIPNNLKDINRIQPESTLYGHTKKINLIQFNPASEGVLASSSLDSTIKIWDVLNGKEKQSMNDQKDQQIYDFKWSGDGSMIVSTWQDKKMILQDPRQESSIFSIKPYQSARPVKCVWMNKQNYILTTGYNQTNSRREIKIWDIKKFDKPILENSIDYNQNMMIPYYDSDLDLLWLGCKGDQAIKYFEYTKTGKLNYLNEYSGACSTRGLEFFPRTCLDFNKNQIAIAAQLTDKKVHIINFTNANKFKKNNEQLYPDAEYDIGQTADDFFKNKNSNNKRKCVNMMNPEIYQSYSLQQYANRKLKFSQMEIPKNQIENIEGSNSNQASQQNDQIETPYIIVSNNNQESQSIDDNQENFQNIIQSEQINSNLLEQNQQDEIQQKILTQILQDLPVLEQRQFELEQYKKNYLILQQENQEKDRQINNLTQQLKNEQIIVINKQQQINQFQLQLNELRQQNQQQQDELNQKQLQNIKNAKIEINKQCDNQIGELQALKDSFIKDDEVNKKRIKELENELHSKNLEIQNKIHRIESDNKEEKQFNNQQNLIYEIKQLKENKLQNVNQVEQLINKQIISWSQMQQLIKTIENQKSLIFNLEEEKQQNKNQNLELLQKMEEFQKLKEIQITKYDQELVQLKASNEEFLQKSEEHYNNMGQIIKQKQEENQKFNEIIQQQKDEIYKLNQSELTSLGNIKQKQKQIQTLQLDFTQLQEQDILFQKQNQVSTEEIQKLEIIIQQKNVQINTLSDNEQSNITKIEQLLQHTENYKNKITKIEQDQVQLQALNKELQQKVKGLNLELKQKLNAFNQDLSQKSGEYYDTINQLTKEKEENNQKFNEIISQQKDEINKLNLSETKNISNITQKTQLIKTLQSEIAQLKEQDQQFKDQNKELFEEFQKLEKIIQQKTDQLNTLRKNEKTASLCIDENKKLKHIIEGLQDEILKIGKNGSENLNNFQQQSKQEIQDLQEIIQQKEDQIYNQKKELQEFNNQIINQKKELQELLQLCQQETEVVKSRGKSPPGKKVEKINEFQQLKNIIQQNNDQIINQKKELQELLQMCQQETVVVKQQGRKFEQINEFQQLKEIIQQKNEQIINLKKELQELNDQIYNQKKEFQELLEMFQQETDVDKRRGKSPPKNVEKINEFQQLKEKIKKNKNQINILLENEKNNQSQITTLQDQISHYDEEQKLILKLQDDLKLKTDQLNILRKNEKTASLCIDENKKLKHIIEGLQDEILKIGQNGSQNLNSVEQQSKQVVQDLQQIIQQKEDQINNQNKELQELIQMCQQETEVVRQREKSPTRKSPLKRVGISDIQQLKEIIQSNNNQINILRKNEKNNQSQIKTLQDEISHYEEEFKLIQKLHDEKFDSNQLIETPQIVLTEESPDIKEIKKQGLKFGTFQIFKEIIKKSDVKILNLLEENEQLKEITNVQKKNLDFFNTSNLSESRHNEEMDTSALDIVTIDSQQFITIETFNKFKKRKKIQIQHLKMKLTCDKKRQSDFHNSHHEQLKQSKNSIINPKDLQKKIKELEERKNNRDLPPQKTIDLTSQEKK